MTPMLLLSVGILLLGFTVLGILVGRRFERSIGASVWSEAMTASAAAQNELERDLALARQAEGQWKETKLQYEKDGTQAREDLRKHAESNQTQGENLKIAQTIVEERDKQITDLKLERDDLRGKLTDAETKILDQAKLLGEAAGLKTSIEELNGIINKRDGEISRIQTDLSDALAKVVGLETAAAKDHEALTNERKQLEDGRQVFRSEFENLANQIFDNKQQVFETRSKDGITTLLNPFREQLETFRLRVDQVHTENVQGHTSLKGELDRLRSLNQQITEEASNLTRALKGDKKVQGNWGEQKVELLLEQSGLRKDHEYSREQNFKDDEGNNLRPDFVVNLPENKHLIIDSKVSLNDYAAYIAAESPEERQRYLAAHVAAIRNHIRSLSEKRYPELVGMESPDFTFLFIAIEPAYVVAVEHAPALFQEAYDKRIVLVTATTLFPVLRVIANLWGIQRQNQFTKELADQASKVYDKLRIFVEKMQTLGGQIETVQKTYKNSFDTLKDGRGSLVKTVERFEQLGVKVAKRLPSAVAGDSLPELGISEDVLEPEGFTEADPVA